MISRAERDRCKAAFYEKARRLENLEQFEKRTSQETQKTRELKDENDYIGLATDIERMIGQTHRAFIFGGHPVRLRTMVSSLDRIQKRDPFGNKIFEARWHAGNRTARHNTGERHPDRRR